MDNVKLNKWVYIVLGAIAVLLLVVWGTKAFSAKRCKELVVNIKNNEESFFVTERDIKDLVTQNGTEPISGMLLERINLRTLEQRAKTNLLVRNCQAYTDLVGNVQIDIEQEQPVARLSSPNGENDVYINAEGKFLPLSKHFSAKVLLVSGSYFEFIPALKGSKNAPLLAFINKIANDDFWKSQISQLDIDKEANIRIVPLVGRHIIEFGSPEHYDIKLQKLHVFYSQITTVKGWENFRKISVKFKDQIVCE